MMGARAAGECEIRVFLTRCRLREVESGGFNSRRLSAIILAAVAIRHRERVALSTRSSTSWCWSGCVTCVVGTVVDFLCFPVYTENTENHRLGGRNLSSASRAVCVPEQPKTP
jgi:hypothetical protein